MEQPNEASSAERKKRSSAGKKTDKKKKKRRKKDTKKREKKRVPRIMTSKEAAHFFPQALLPLVESGFFTTKDLGHLLLRTSKAMTVAGLGDEEDTIWKPLCASYWGAEKSKSVLESLAPMSPKICFRELAVMQDKKAFQGPRPLQYTPQDYAFIISIKEHETGKPILCKTIPGQDISKFFDNGKAKVMFEKPLWEEDLVFEHDGPHYAMLDMETLEPFVAPVPFASLKWDGTLHILRRPDQHMVRFVKHEEREDRVELGMDDDGNEELNVESEPNRCFLPPGVASHYGRALFEHYECYDVEFGGFEMDFDIEWRKSGTDGLVGVYGFDIYSRICQDQCYNLFWETMKGKDVSAAHFLEAVMEK